MRPVERGKSPQSKDYHDYHDAFPDLVSRLGQYCSYCERRIPTNLAVEHIQPKGLPAYASLIGRWENLLVACVNCNSTKGDKDVDVEAVLLPDRDNTFAAFDYPQDGWMIPAAGLTAKTSQMATATLQLCGLDRSPSAVTDANGQLVAIDRYSQRLEAWGVAKESKGDLKLCPTDRMRRQIVRTAVAYGHFSIWMKVFEADPQVRQMLISAFPGTATSCFDCTTAPITPRPANGLVGSGKS